MQRRGTLLKVHDEPTIVGVHKDEATYLVDCLVSGKLLDSLTLFGSFFTPFCDNLSKKLYRGLCEQKFLQLNLHVVRRLEFRDSFQVPEVFRHVRRKDEEVVHVASDERKVSEDFVYRPLKLNGRVYETKRHLVIPEGA